MSNITNKEKSKTLHQMIRELRGNLCFFNVIATAARKGWFSTGTLLTRLTEEEQDWFHGFLVKNPSLKEILLLPISELTSGSFIGPMLRVVQSFPKETEYPYTPAVLKLQTNFEKPDIVYFRTWQYFTLKERHPDCSFHMKKWNNSENEIVLVLKDKKICGAIMPYNVF
jgi:hypothetical protein